MIIAILNALGNSVAQRCISSMLETASSSDFDILLIRERGFREKTLNAALAMAGISDDVLFVGDDIEFTPGWYEALQANYEKADILGMSMLYPRTTKVQDRGYDLVQIEDRITLEAKDRGLSKDEIAAFDTRRCDALCGCFMLVKKNVFDCVSGFKEDGQNRWGEFIFFCEAMKKGKTIAVIDHFLYHGGKSTKSNPDKALSSTSYQVEKKIWENIVLEHVDSSMISRKYSCNLSEQLRHLLASAEDILFYGAGTVTEHLLKYINDKNVTICSGLSEEKGILFNGYKIENYEKALLRPFDLIVITPLHIAQNLYRSYIQPNLDENNCDPKIIGVKRRIGNMKYVYDMELLQ
jgi:hypothetical protein